jgi:hypothetical protein
LDVCIERGFNNNIYKEDLDVYIDREKEFRYIYIEDLDMYIEELR